ncbi:MAG: Co2+/Mg2+ efflux protein ApaG [Methylotenera sp.]|nr:Co2+/Mg2+ efflux protein ApaG [Methylotenera sp.]MDO9233910.1 Co2+/Mg2+ efflux protein ApaG [Methylotenera sp.]MDO9387936.1 Co2+/Mg2+ efflux protein ApaG [Methylotenera sp.]MDP2102730.1 Co2+/Mg2+ efflux protein ApaG [Methylotenera sp.]MDP2282370.1 Co2+/Mg2+ efflux protein ApaG [Methylotenera sp.]
MTSAKHYECTVKVEVTFIAEQSDIEHNRYAFAYHVTITNTGSVAAQLISRHWIITEANGEQQEIKGLGVVGAQPLLKPSAQFEYTSGTLINTPMGEMKGTYQMVAEDGVQFDAVIPAFSLVMPRVLH